MQILNMFKFHSKLSRRLNCEVLEHFSQHLARLMSDAIVSVSIINKAIFVLKLLKAGLKCMADSSTPEEK